MTMFMNSFLQDVAGPLSFNIYLNIVTLLLKSQNTLVGDRDKIITFFMDGGIGIFSEPA